MTNQLPIESVDLLTRLIKTPSLSGDEDGTAGILEAYLSERRIPCQRMKNNLVVKNKRFDASLKTIVLNSHHDTVRPNKNWVSDPFGASQEEGKIIGLGSNDAGASVVSLLAAFLHFYDRELEYNLVLILSAEEENFGPNGIKHVLKEIDFRIELAIVGEPTEMKMAIAEKGLLVIDGLAKGEAGHAARPNGKNAIDMALRDIHNINAYEFAEVSDTLGKVVKSVTQISAGYQHNVIPDVCQFVIDVRVNDRYTLHEVFDILCDKCESELVARSFSNHSSGIREDHWIIEKGRLLGIEMIGSDTLSDQANFTCDSIKMGPGKSTRSHQADEYVMISEIAEGIDIYMQLLASVLIKK